MNAGRKADKTTNARFPNIAPRLERIRQPYYTLFRNQKIKPSFRDRAKWIRKHLTVIQELTLTSKKMFE